MAKLQAITFIKAITPYREGEVATFDTELAGKYIEQKFAKQKQKQKKKAINKPFLHRQMKNPIVTK